MFMLIPAAGESRRFKEAGYSTPKPFLEVAKHLKMIDAVASMAPSGATVLTAIRSGVPYMPDTIKDENVVRLHHATRGQAATVAILASLISPNEELLVANCDGMVAKSEVERFVAECRQSPAASGVMTIKRYDPCLSYVAGHPFAQYFAEKRVISEDAVIGIYWFRHAFQLRESIETQMLMQHAQGEVYLTPALAWCRPCLNFSTGSSPWRSWGTPEEYKTELERG